MACGKESEPKEANDLGQTTWAEKTGPMAWSSQGMRL
jgi:hypothetical protein